MTLFFQGREKKPSHIQEQVDMANGEVSLHGLPQSTAEKDKGAYITIPEVDHDEGEAPTPVVEQGKTSQDLFRLGTRVGLVLILVILLAIYGQRASHIDAIQNATGPDGTIDVAVSGDTHLPNLRPCQILRTDNINGRPQVLQTSMSQPSSQWSEVACFESFDTGTSWELLFKGDGNHRKLTASEFALPSAVIQVDFDNVVHKNRPPILGFGGAFTEASALNYKRLSVAGKRAFIELMFGESGLGYR